jgi:hypothetical protein
VRLTTHVPGSLIITQSEKGGMSHTDPPRSCATTPVASSESAKSAPPRHLHPSAKSWRPGFSSSRQTCGTLLLAGAWTSERMGYVVNWLNTFGLCVIAVVGSAVDPRCSSTESYPYRIRYCRSGNCENARRTRLAERGYLPRACNAKRRTRCRRRTRATRRASPGHAAIRCS